MRAVRIGEMSESRFRKPYQAVQQRHEDARGEALAGLAEAGQRLEAWEKEQPRLEDRLGRQLERLWKDELGLRPFPRFRKRVPAMPPQRIGRRLRRFRRRRLRGYRKALRRLGRAAAESWPARRMRLEMAWRRLRLRVSPGWALLVLVALALVLIDRFAPSVIEDLLARFVARGSGP